MAYKESSLSGKKIALTGKELVRAEKTAVLALHKALRESVTIVGRGVPQGTWGEQRRRSQERHHLLARPITRCR
jgi:hypothetical protein